ncbi:MAG: hypothetical protein WKF43_11035, partial [Acidimicrobiales bacterium]
MERQDVGPVANLAVAAGVIPAAPRAALQPKLVLMAADIALVAVSIVITYVVAIPNPGNFGGRSDPGSFLPYALLTLPVWLGIFSHQRLYNTRFIGRRIDEVRRIVNAVVLGVVSVALTGYMFGVLMSRWALAVLFMLCCALITVEREIARHVFARLRHGGRMVRHVVIAGA